MHHHSHSPTFGTNTKLIPFKPPAKPLDRNTDAQRLIIKSPSQIKQEHIHQTGVNQAA